MSATSESINLVGGSDDIQVYYGHTRNEIVSLIPEGVVRLMDVGCAEGRFGAKVLADRPGSEAWGVELVPEIAARAKDRLTRVLVGSIEEHLGDIPDGYFNCITFNDVLEHLTDPWKILRQVRSKLSADGVVIASIPNVRNYAVLKALLYEGDFKYESQGILDRTHLRFFTKKSMGRLFSESGYTVARVEGLDWKSLPWWLSILNRLLRRSFDDMCYTQFAILAKPSS